MEKGLINRVGKTYAQLRDAIDRGQTGSKVPYPDPAAAPLGTDDEAGGAPTDPELIEQVMQRETANPARHDENSGNALPKR